MQVYFTIVALLMSNFILAEDKQGNAVISSRAEMNLALISLLENAPFAGDETSKVTKPLSEYAAFVKSAIISREAAVAVLANGYGTSAVYSKCVARFSRSASTSSFFWWTKGCHYFCV